MNDIAHRANLIYGVPNIIHLPQHKTRLALCEQSLMKLIHNHKMQYTKFHSHIGIKLACTIVYLLCSMLNNTARSSKKEVHLLRHCFSFFFCSHYIRFGSQKISTAGTQARVNET